MSPATHAAPANAVRIPITNIPGGGAYSAEVSIGNPGKAVNLLLDTGSATLAVESSVYDASDDAALMVTSLAQLITYGGGGFAGPVVTTSVDLGGVIAKDVSMAVAVVQEGSLGALGGVLGLAYGGINPGFDFAPYFAAKGMPATTFPWPFGSGALAEVQGELQAIVQTYNMQSTPITPCLDKLAGAVSNRFAFYALRSCPSMRLGADSAAHARDPLNNGVFVLGGGESETDFFVGDFLDVAVVHDQFYNVNLQSVRVAGCEPVVAAPLQTAYQPTLVSNAIIDTGNVKLTLAADIHQAVLAGLASLGPAFAEAAASGQQAAAALNLPAWPSLYFTFTGADGAAVELAVAPQTYWQTDWPAPGQASFRIGGPLSDANQSNLGLPLLNNYFTVFDRSAGPQGVVRFASIKSP